MKDEELKSKTVSELESEIKKIKAISGAVLGITLILGAVTIYGLITKEDKSSDMALLVVALATGAIIPTQLSSIKKIKTELKSRKNNI
jgi:FtsH-binding integral membrane protein